MSGGYYDYAHLKLEEFLDAMRLDSRAGDQAAPAPVREMFREHLRLVVAAMYAIEWNDSGDGLGSGRPTEESLILACLNGGAVRAALHEISSELVTSLRALQELEAAAVRARNEAGDVRPSYARPGESIPVI